MIRSISDKVIDEQGNVATFCSGSDARLIYQNNNGELKKYLIEGEGGGGGTTYITTTTFPTSLSSNTKVTVTSPVSELNLTFDPSVNGAEIVFTTDTTVTNNLVIPSGMFITKNLNKITSEKTYKIIVDNNIIELITLKESVPFIVPSGLVAVIDEVNSPSQVFEEEVNEFDAENGITVTLVWVGDSDFNFNDDLYDNMFGNKLFIGNYMNIRSSAWYCI